MSSSTRLIILCTFLLEIPTGLNAEQPLQFESRTRREPSCTMSCLGVEKKTVCATDGLTYPSRCEVRRTKKCERKDIRVKHTGQCPITSRIELSSRSKCFEEKEQASKFAKHPGIYIPECNSDGTYAEIQCHTATRYCWCVTHDGKPVPGSSVKDKRPACGGSTSKRRSARKEEKDCSQAERSEFNTNLIKLFSEEYARIPRPAPNQDKTGLFPGGLPIRAESDSLLKTPQKRVIEWKFSELDENKDSELKSKELKSLRRMVRKVVKPRSCAKMFVKNCDSDNNGSIGRDEWSICLGVGINYQRPVPKSTDVPLDSKIPEVEQHITSFSSSNGPTLWNRQHGGLSPRRQVDPAEDRSPDNEDKIRNCHEERKAAEEMDKLDPEGRIFIPRCEDDGRYQKAQCHTSTGYCWCVDEKSGKPIPGTSTHKVQPSCDDIPEGGIKTNGKPPTGRVPSKYRVLKGCPDHKKLQYLQELLDQLTTEMVQYFNNGSADKRLLPEPNPDHSLEERVVRWKLRMLDTNNNGVIDKRERRKFKQEVRKTKSLRKCGRNFVNYCDADSNKKITVDELTDCMGLNKDDIPLIGDEPAPRLPSAHKRRRGPNPFIGHLT